MSPTIGPSLRLQDLGDKYQLLFVTMVLNHVRHVLECLAQGKELPQLKLMLLGTAGTGKTRAIQTLLQELHRVLKEQEMPMNFVAVAAPTGCAAFNIRFNACTIQVAKPAYVACTQTGGHAWETGQQASAPNTGMIPEHVDF